MSGKREPILPDKRRANGQAIRPLLEAGVTPLAGLRLGAYLTRGGYLGRDAAPSLPPGAAPGDYHERVAGFDLQFSCAHFELDGEFTATILEIPGAGTPRRHVAYLEPKITWSPRWFAALRLEQGRLVSAEPEIGAPWTVEEGRIRDLEAGIGFRVDPRLLVKASYRTGFAGGAAGMEATDGNAFALQLSCSFDAVAWFTSPR